MFEFSNFIEFAKAEPGHGLLQSGLLFMIWLSSRSLKKELEALKAMLEKFEIGNEMRFRQVENRVSVLEIKQNKGG